MRKASYHLTNLEYFASSNGDCIGEKMTAMANSNGRQIHTLNLETVLDAIGCAIKQSIIGICTLVSFKCVCACVCMWQRIELLEFKIFIVLANRRQSDVKQRQFDAFVSECC